MFLQQIGAPFCHQQSFGFDLWTCVQGGKGSAASASQFPHLDLFCGGNVEVASCDLPFNTAQYSNIQSSESECLEGNQG